MFDYSFSRNENGVIESVDLFSTETGELVETISKSDFDSKYRICEHCGKVFPHDEMTYCESDGAYYCEDCRDDCLYQCEDCEGWFDRDEMREVRLGWNRYKWLCNDCSDEYGTTCHHCGEWHVFDELIYCVDTERYFCSDNWRCSDDIRYCGDCGDAYEYTDELHWNDEDECYYCDHCNSRHQSFQSSSVTSYHSHSYTEFRHNEGENRILVPFMGFELETYAEYRDCESEVADYTSDQFDTYFAMERDCSIGAGIEFISQPCSLSYHLGMMDDIKEWARYLIRNGYNSHNSARCGFHVHLDKRYFEKKLDCATAKLLFLFERHWENMVRFSRRNASQVADWCGKYCESDQQKSRRDATQVVPGKKYASILKKENKERYRAVNLCPENTIEIRMWRGSLNPETIEATLKFTARLAELCKKASAIELYHMTFEELLGDDPVVRSYWERVKDRAI